MSEQFNYRNDPKFIYDDIIHKTQEHKLIAKMNLKNAGRNF